MSLSRARGAVLIGRPLDLSIGATLDATDPETPCFEADIYQGDTRIDLRRIQLRWEPGAAGSGHVRVIADVPIEEPVVTVYLRVGCTSKVTRRFVLFAEPPPEGTVAPPVAVRPPSVAAATPPSGLTESVPAPPAPRARRVEPPLPPQAVFVPATPPAAAPAPVLRATPAASSVPVAPRAEARPAAAVPPPVARERPATARAQPRLKLEPVDVSVEPEPALKSSTWLQNEPTDDPQKRAQAAALWQALNASPEDAMRSSERLQALERDMRALHGLTQKNVAALEVMREQVEKARGERNTVLQVAIGLGVLLALLVLVVIWRSRSFGSRADWWRSRGALLDDEDEDELIATHRSSAPGRLASTPAALATPPDSNDSLPPRRQAAGDTGRERMAQRSGPISSLPPADFQGSQSASWRMVNAEELIDIQQQADFFRSIGQPERAISLLEGHLQSQLETSALAWLDLLELYHDLDRRDDFERVRGGFQERFNASVPGFDQFRSAQMGLEHYSRAMSRIMALWPSRRVLGVIEESLFRKPGDPGGEPFDLEAYRELVLLYNVATELANDSGTVPAQLSPPMTDFMRTDLQGLPTDDLEGMSGMADLELPELAPDLELGVAPARTTTPLDIDLTKLGDEPPVTEAPAGASGPMLDLDSLDWSSLRR